MVELIGAAVERTARDVRMLNLEIKNRNCEFGFLICDPSRTLTDDS